MLYVTNVALKGGLFIVLMFTDKGDESAFLPTGTSFNARTCSPNISD